MTAPQPKAPESLGEIGAAKWRELVPRLVGAAATRSADLDQLEVYCANYERWRAAMDWLAKHGDVLEIVSDKGVVLKAQPAPKLDVAAQCEKAMRDALARLRFRTLG